MRRDQELVELFVRGYNTFFACSYCIFDRPEEHNSGRPEVQALARDASGRILAIEHTLVQPFVGEKSDAQRFLAVLGSFEKDPALLVTGYHIAISVPVDSIQVGVDWGACGALLRNWFLANRALFPVGGSKWAVELAGLSLPVLINKWESDRPSVTIGRIWRDESFLLVIDNSFQKKLPKLASTDADLRVLLFEKDSLPRGYKEFTRAIELLRSKFDELPKISAVWVVDTFAWQSEGFLQFIQVWPLDTSCRFNFEQQFPGYIPRMAPSLLDTSMRMLSS